MIRGVHTMFYSSDAKALRQFIRDRLGFPCADVGDISFHCDDIEETVSELEPSYRKDSRS